jgi:Helix-turn-helix domain
MSGKGSFTGVMREARGLSCDEFVRMIDGGCPMRSGEVVSIKDLAVELGVSVRTLRRRNKLPDAPKRYRQGRRLMYRHADVQHWFARSKGTPGAGHDARDDGSP